MLGFIEGEGCFSYRDFSMYFSLVQTGVNRHVLLAIRDYMLGFAPQANISIIDVESQGENKGTLLFKNSR